MTNLKFIGHNLLPSFDNNFSINQFFDIVTSHFSSSETEYILHVVSVGFNGIPLNEWIKFDTSLTNLFDGVTELQSYILSRINICHKINSTIAKSISDDDNKFFENKIKYIHITYYTFRG